MLIGVFRRITCILAIIFQNSIYWIALKFKCSKAYIALLYFHDAILMWQTRHYTYDMEICSTNQNASTHRKLQFLSTEMLYIFEVQDKFWFGLEFPQKIFNTKCSSEEKLSMISKKLRKNDLQKIALFVFHVCRIVEEGVKDIMFMTIIISDDRWVSRNKFMETWRYFHLLWW